MAPAEQAHERADNRAVDELHLAHVEHEPGRVPLDILKAVAQLIRVRSVQHRRLGPADDGNAVRALVHDEVHAWPPSILSPLSTDASRSTRRSCAVGPDAVSKSRLRKSANSGGAAWLRRSR